MSTPREPFRVRLPGFTGETTAEVGLGEAIKRATSAAGLKPCAPCLRRAAYLDRWVTFTRGR